jgi:hypothetical protein
MHNRVQPRVSGVELTGETLREHSIDASTRLRDTFIRIDGQVGLAEPPMQKRAALRATSIARGDTRTLASHAHHTPSTTMPAAPTHSRLLPALTSPTQLTGTVAHFQAANCIKAAGLNSLDVPRVLHKFTGPDGRFRWLDFVHSIEKNSKRISDIAISSSTLSRAESTHEILRNTHQRMAATMATGEARNLPALLRVGSNTRLPKRNKCVCLCPVPSRPSRSHA